MSERSLPKKRYQKRSAAGAEAGHTVFGGIPALGNLARFSPNTEDPIRGSKTQAKLLKNLVGALGIEPRTS